MRKFCLNSWQRIVLDSKDSIGKAIDVLNNEGSKILMISDDTGSLLGTITDGDIRRALAQFKSMNTSLSNVMFKNPITASLNDTKEAIYSTMVNHDIMQIPIVDEHGKIVGLQTLQTILDADKKNNTVLLMAGGFGKRLKPLTDSVPKPMLKIGKKPILENIIERFIGFGFNNFLISTHHMAGIIHEYFGDGNKWNVNINYINEEIPLGTAGTLGLLTDHLLYSPIIMINGDILTKINFESLLNFHNEQGGGVTMCVREYDFTVPYGVVESKMDKITDIVEKPVHSFFVNAGIYVLDKSVIKYVDKGVYLDMPNFLKDKIISNMDINMFPVHEYWIDIGHIDEYNRANLEIDNENV